MSKTYTDSATVDHHEDGSWTVTTVETHYPATRGQKAAAWTGLVAICVAPFVPLAAIIGIDQWEKRRERREQKKREKIDLKSV